MQVVFGDDGWWNHLDGNADVLRAFEWCHEVVIFDIGGNPMCVVGYNRLQKGLHNGHVSASRGNITRIVDSVTACGSAHAEGALAVVAHLFLDLRVVVGCVAAAFLGLLGILYSTHSLCAAEEAIKLVDVRLVPLRSVRAGECSGEGKRRAVGREVEWALTVWHDASQAVCVSGDGWRRRTGKPGIGIVRTIVGGWRDRIGWFCWALEPDVSWFSVGMGCLA